MFKTWYDVLQPEAKKAMEWLVKRFHDIILVLSDSKPLFTRQKKKIIQRRKVFQLFKTVEKTDCNIEMWLLIDWFKFLENVIKYRGDIKSYQF